MDGISIEVLKRLLPLLEQSLAPILPVSFKLKEEGDDLPLEFRGHYLGNLVLSSDGLSQEELSRWRPTVLALAHELLNRLLNENLIDGLPGPRVLESDLKQWEFSGLLVKGPRPKGERFYALSPGLYFLPEEEVRPREFLYPLWAKGEDFTAVSVKFSSPEDLNQAGDLIWLAEAFGFTWLSGRALKYLAEEWAFSELDKIKKGLFPLVAAAEKHRLLVLAEGPEEALLYLAGQAIARYEINSTKGLFVLDLPVEEALSLLEEWGLLAGVYPGGEALPPLGAVWAAFEHGRRLKTPQAMVFSGFTYHVAGDLYADLGDLGAALKAYLLGKQGTVQPVDLLNSLAVIMIQLGRRKEARKFLEEAISLSPKDPVLYYNLGLFLREEGHPEAEAYFQKAYSLAPKEEIFALAWAKSLAKKAQWTKVKEVLSGRKLSAKGLFLLAEACYQLGQLKEAFSLFKDVARLEPRNAKALAYLALLFAKLEGEKEVAQSLAKQARGLDPQGVSDLLDSLEEFPKEDDH